MRYLDRRLLLVATDLSDFLSCEHLTQLSLRAAGGEELRTTETKLGKLLRELGAAHETGWVDARESEGSRVKRFDEDASWAAASVDELRRATEATLEAMREGWDIIYQPTLFDGVWLGRADFLVRVPAPSGLGPFSYEVYDAKLARHVRAEALLQLAEYSLQVSRLQQAEPERMHVVLGDGSVRAFLTADFSAYHLMVRDQVWSAVSERFVTYPDRVPHCNVCEYAGLCEDQRRADDHLSLVARMRRDQIRKLNAAGIRRLDELGRLPADVPVAQLPQASLDALRAQARLQLEGRINGAARPLYELLANDEPGFGLSALPAASPGDVFFDMEGDAIGREQTLEYLFGAVEVAGGVPRYHHWLGHTVEEERRAFEGFIDWVTSRLEAHPDMHVYHYADYERSALQRLMGRHGTREAEVDRLLRGNVLVDLYRVVRQSVRLSTEGYGLKQVERLYLAPRTGDVADAESSVIVYAQWLRSGDAALLDSIVRYNEVDCVSTMRLREWLEARRAEVESARGAPLDRPAVRTGAAPEKVAEYQTEAAALRAQLTEPLPADAASRSEAEAATWLLAQLLEYHRRESKVAWWRWYRLTSLTSEELSEDRDALGPLTVDGVVASDGKTDVVRYRFDPQEHAVREGRTAFTPCVRDGERDGESAGQVALLDNARGVIELRRGRHIGQRPHPEYLIPERPFSTSQHARALLAVGRWVAEHGMEAPGAHHAARDLLLRTAPRRRSRGPLRAAGETAEAAAARVVCDLDAGCLPVQGPPGSGKTYAAARIALELVARGRRVAVTATAHKVISRLLEEIAGAAEASGEPVRIAQRIDDEGNDPAGCIRRMRDNASVIDAVESGAADVVGGTTWLLTLEELAGRFDTLIVDEAGQMSLADVIAASRCARNLVLVGDPRQLAQVVQGSHPDGAGVSALEHLLGDGVTVAGDRGIFLDRTWRMAPGVCAFVSSAFYEGKLQPVTDTARQAIDVDAPLPMSGLRTLEVAHAGDRTYSPAEADQVVALVADLLGRTWRHRDGSLHRVSLRDLLVVAPYNAHVACLTERLPEGARVGTVDRFQGQEAAVSIFSMATSSTDDLPRNLEFLYSSNRLNVAVSRARCLAVLVYSPALLRTRCRTPEQMRLVNALCRYVRAAQPWQPRAADAASMQLSLLPAGAAGGVVP